jgi:Multiubiquitin
MWSELMIRRTERHLIDSELASGHPRQLFLCMHKYFCASTWSLSAHAHSVTGTTIALATSMKQYNIFVNGGPNIWNDNEISYAQLAALAFPQTAPNSTVKHTIVFERGHGNKPEGSLTEGQSTHVKEGMLFNVTETGLS